MVSGSFTRIYNRQGFTETQTDRQTDRETQRETERDRDTERDRERQRETERDTEREVIVKEGWSLIKTFFHQCTEGGMTRTH